MSDESVTFGRRVTMLALERPTDTALVFVTAAGEDIPVSWRELEAMANRAAHRLAADGVGPGSMVVIELANSIEHVASALGAWKVGACVLPLRWDLPDWERDRVLAAASPTVVVGTRGGDQANEIAVDDLFDESLPADALPDLEPRPAWAMATSGSTGTPKIIISHSAGADVPGRMQTNAFAKRLRYRPGHRQLIAGPLYHNTGFVSMHVGLFEAQLEIVMERFIPELVLDVIERFRVNTTSIAPIMLQRMVRVPDIDQRDLSSIESITIGGASLPDWLARRGIELFGAEQFFIVYGSSENTGLALASGSEWLEHPGTVGRPLQSEVRILDSDGSELPIGTIGEVYLRWVGQSARSFDYRGGTPNTRDDLFSSIGDMGYVDGDGYMYIVDRRTDMIVSGGSNVYASEVEAALTEHPAVKDAVVVGRPDPEWGRRVHAVVELDPAMNSPSIDDLREHCRARLASYKVPKSIEFVSSLARSASGKIRRSDYQTDSPVDASTTRW